MPFLAFPREFFVKATGPGRAWTRRLSPRIERRLRQILAAEIAELRGSVKLKDLDQVALYGNPALLADVVPVERIGSVLGGLNEPLIEVIEEGGRLAYSELGQPIIGLDMTSPAIRGWLDAHLAERVTQFNITSQRALFSVLQDGIQKDRHPKRLAKDLRAVVGLTEPHAFAVARRRDKLIEAGMNLDRVEQVTDRYARRLIRVRAENIARTETMNAINFGRAQVWQSLKDSGDLESDARKVWLTAADERVCPICGPMNNVDVEVGDPWLLPNGTSVEHPPAHPSCRCTEVLK